MRYAMAVTMLAIGSVATGCGSDSSALPDELAAPDEIATLIDDWFDANTRGDGSVLELYTPEAYHLYGPQRFEYDQIADHLAGGGWEHEWTTPALLIADDGNGQFVATRGMRVSHPAVGSDASALTFEIRTVADGSLLISESAWFYRN